MTEAERYLEEKRKGATVAKSTEPSSGKGNSHGASEEKKHRNPSVDKSGKGWSVALVVLGLISTAFFMLFFESCFARF